MKVALNYRLFLGMPISVLTCPGTPELVLHRQGSYGYLVASSTALDVQGRTNAAMTGCQGAVSRTSPAPTPEILVRYAG